MNATELKHHRKTMGHTQSKLADEIGVSREWISSLENGKRKISKAIELSVLYLASK